MGPAPMKHFFSDNTFMDKFIKISHKYVYRQRSGRAARLEQGGYMKYGKVILTIAFSLLMLGGAFATSTQAQRLVVVRPVVRPVYVRPYFGHYWGWRYYDPFWADMYKTPYERYQEERYYAQSNLRDKEKDLRKH